MQSRVVFLAVLLSMASGCTDPVSQLPATQLDDTPPQAYVESKADLPWSAEGLAAGWRDTMVCVASLGDGVVTGAERFAVGLWHLPGMLASLITKIGRAFIQRAVDLMMAITDEEALARVRATTDEDKRRLLELLATIRRSIPEMWLALDSGTDWFGELDHEERVQLVCEVTGRVAFEVLIVIAGDKGLSKLMGMSRIQLVHGVQSRAMHFISAARIARLGKRAVIDVGAKIAGARRIRWSDPARRFGPLSPAAVYAAVVAGERDHSGLALPALGRYDEEQDMLTLLVHGADWEDTPGYGYLDVLLSTAESVPVGAIVAEGPISFSEAAMIVQASEANVRDWGGGTLDALAEGVEYQRYFVPADQRTMSQTSAVSTSIERRFEFLAELTGEDLRSAVETVAEYSELTPAERVGYLDTLIHETDSAL